MRNWKITLFFATVTENNILNIDGAAVSNSVEFIKIHFSFPKTWASFAKTVVFKNGSTKCSVILNKKNKLCIGTDECYVPFEVIKTPMFSFAVYGVSGERKATSSWAVIRVIKGCGDESDQPSKPTPSEYEQLVSIVNRLPVNPLTNTAVGVNAVRVEDVSPEPQYLEIKVENKDGTIPDSPVKLYMYGRNLIPYPYNIAKTTTVNGITFTDNGDGTITASGTAEENVVFEFTAQEEITIPKGKYMFSGCPAYESEDIEDIVMTAEIGGQPVLFTSSDYEAVKGEINASGKMNFKIWINKGVVANNLVFKPLLEAGSFSYGYEPYKQPKIVSVDPKNPEPMLSTVSPALTVLSDVDGIKISFEYIVELNAQFKRMWEVIRTSVNAISIMADALNTAFGRDEDIIKIP